MRGWLRRTTGGLPRTFWLLWAGTLINRLGSFVIIFLAIYLTRELGYSQSRAGLVLGLYGAGGAAGTMLGGVLADRWGRRPTLLTAHLGAATLMISLGFARDYWQLAAGALLLGLFADAARPAFSAVMVDIVDERDRLRAFSLNYWAINLGFALAAVLAGLAAELDYVLLFVIDAGTTLVTAIIVLCFVAETRPARTTQPAPGAGRTAGLGTVFRDRVFIVYVALNLPIIMVIMQHLSTLPIAMSADGLSPATFGWVIAVNGVLIVAGQLFVPAVIAGRDRSRVIALACVITGVGFGSTALADTAWLFAATVVIWTLGEMLQSPSNSALIAELSPAHLRGRYQGVSSLSWALASAVAPVGGGYVQEHLGDAVLWSGCAVIGVLVALGHLAAGPARERRVAQMRATRPVAPTTPTTAPAAPPNVPVAPADVAHPDALPAPR